MPALARLRRGQVYGTNGTDIEDIEDVIDDAWSFLRQHRRDYEG